MGHFFSSLGLFHVNRLVIPSIDNLSFEWYSWLFRHPGAEVRRITARSGFLDLGLHRFCSESDDLDIRLGIAGNPNIIHASILDKLREDTDLNVQRLAKSNLVKDRAISLEIKDAISRGADTKLHDLGEKVEPKRIAVDPVTQDYNGILQADKKAHPIVFGFVLLLLLCAGLGLMLFGSKNDKAVKSDSPAIITLSPALDEAKYVTLMTEALSIAGSNLSKSKDAETPSQWKLVVQEWDNVIDLLEKIPPSSSLYKAAQERIDIYRGSRSAAKKKSINK